MSNVNNGTDPPEARCICVCECVRGEEGGASWASGSRQQRSFPTAVAIYLCLGPPGRSDTNGITLTVGQRVRERERKEFVSITEGGGGEEGRESSSRGEKVYLKRINLLEAGRGQHWEQ